MIFEVGFIFIALLLGGRLHAILIDYLSWTLFYSLFLFGFPFSIMPFLLLFLLSLAGRCPWPSWDYPKIDFQWIDLSWCIISPGYLFYSPAGYLSNYLSFNIIPFKSLLIINNRNNHRILHEFLYIYYYWR